MNGKSGPWENAAEQADEANGRLRRPQLIGRPFGGAVSLLQSADAQGLRGVIACYGWPSGSPDFPHRPAPVDSVGEYNYPVLAIFGGEDHLIPLSDMYTASVRRSKSENWSTGY